MKNKNPYMNFEDARISRCSECGLEVVAQDYNFHSRKCSYCSYKDTAEYLMEQRRKAFAEWLEATTKKIYKAERGYLKMEMETQTPFELPTFKGYTIDKRLRQFRKVSKGENPKIEFIDFDSEEGQVLLDELWQYFKFLREE